MTSRDAGHLTGIMTCKKIPVIAWWWGGGAGGISCARALVRAGGTSVVLDKQALPRDKICAGGFHSPPFAMNSAGLFDTAKGEPATTHRFSHWGDRRADLSRVGHAQYTTVHVELAGIPDRCRGFDHKYRSWLAPEQVRLGRTLRSMHRRARLLGRKQDAESRRPS